jgi:hypothetical protein
MTPAEGVDNFRRLRAQIEELSRVAATLAAVPSQAGEDELRHPLSGPTNTTPPWLRLESHWIAHVAFKRTRRGFPPPCCRS